jgi:excisionase family DNA binding protein
MSHIDPSEGELLTVAEVAEHLGCTGRHVRQLLHDGKLPRVRIGVRAVRIPSAALSAWLKDRTDVATRNIA